MTTGRYGLLDIPKFKDYRNKVKRHSWKTFPVLRLTDKTDIVIHHSLTKQGLKGSNAEGYARFHVDSHGWPSIGYSYVIEPDGTIKWVNGIELRTYHVGNHNNYCVGIVLTGDFRYEKPTEEQEESLRNLVPALKKKYTHLKNVNGHNEYSGYEWKACPEFDFRSVLNQKGSNKKPESNPKTYTIQEGDTLYSIAKGLSGISADDLEKANPNVEPTELQVGQVINLGNAKSVSSSSNVSPSQPSKWKKVNGNWTGQTLGKGEYGEPVRQLQTKLANNEPPFYPNKNAKNNGIDSYYGDDTEGAVRRFQSYYGLTVDGLAGKQVYNQLGGTTSTSTVSTSATSNDLKIDGKWGKDTTRALQRVLGTKEDGIISNQFRNSVTTSLYGNTVQFSTSGKGSVVIREMQKKIHSTSDGLLGPNTVRQLQRHYGSVVDGKLSRPSLVVEKMQRRLNRGVF